MFIVLYAAGGLDKVAGESLYVEDDVCYIGDAEGHREAVFPMNAVVGIISADALTENDSQVLGLSDAAAEE